MALLGTCYITASLDIRNAQNIHASAITEIEASNCSDAVIEACSAKAVENGYRNEDGSSGLNVHKVMTAKGAVAEVKLNYSYTIPLLNTTLKHEIIGYAR